MRAKLPDSTSLSNENLADIIIDAICSTMYYMRYELCAPVSSEASEVGSRHAFLQPNTVKAARHSAFGTLNEGKLYEAWQQVHSLSGPDRGHWGLPPGI